MKKKLRLQIEKLRVEQFDVHPDSPVARGTVHGFDSVYNSNTEPMACYCQNDLETQRYQWTECCH
jgi:hypothetical protein